KPADPAPAVSGPPPKVALVTLAINDKRVRVAHPPDWDGEVDEDGHWIQMIGPDGEGEILIGLATQPPELTPYLDGLRERHPGSTPSPPQSIDVPGIDAAKGERATRFQITGGEV